MVLSISTALKAMCNPAVTLVLWKGVSLLLRPGTSTITGGRGEGWGGKSGGFPIWTICISWMDYVESGLREGKKADMSVEGHYLY